MRRTFYRGFLALHPASFRKQFADEMTCVFEQALRDGEAAGYCTDAAISLLRQWIKNRAAWTVLLAGIGGTLPLFWGLMVARTLPQPVQTMIRLNDSVEAFLIATVATLFFICFTIATTVSLFRTLRRRV